MGLVFSPRARRQTYGVVQLLGYIIDLIALKSTLMNLYATPAWTQVMFSVFVNYPLNNPSYKGEARKRQELENLLN